MTVLVPESLTHLGGVEVATDDFLAATARAAAKPIWVVDRDGLILFANPAAVAALGYDDVRELAGRDGHATIHGDDGHPAAECPMLEARRSGAKVTRDVDRFARRDGSTFPATWVSAPFDMPTGRGVVVAFTDIEARLQAEQALRERDARLAEVQGSLRRLAATAARGASSGAVFAAIAKEVAHVMRLPMVALFRYDSDEHVTVIGEWSDRAHKYRVGTRWSLDGDSVMRRVILTGRPARADDLQGLRGTLPEAWRASGLGRVAGAPIIVDGQVWGTMGTSSPDAPFPDDIEERLADFTALVATAISNSHAREELHRLADEQAALRRVATLVAEGASPTEVFEAVAREATVVLEWPRAAVGLFRYLPDGRVTVVAATGDHPFGQRTVWPLDGPTLATLVRDSGQSARVDSYAELKGTIGNTLRQAGFEASVGAAIVVDGQLWGVMSACSRQPGPLPADTESRLSQFTALVGTAISNTQAHEDLRRVADEQAARRRLATLIAKGVELETVFDAICEETGAVLSAGNVSLTRFTPGEEPDPTVAEWSADGFEPPTDGGAAIKGLVRKASVPRRIDARVGAPVWVVGRVWGALVATGHGPDRLPGGVEKRLASFADMAGTAVSNAMARDELVASRARIVAAADEQRRRVVRDLHGGAQQRLLNTIGTLKLASEALGGSTSSATELVDDALFHTKEATKELRELARGVLPAALTRGGLRTGLAAFAARASVPVALDVPATRFASSVEATAYFVVAEALTNVAKHACAGRASVSVVVVDGALNVRVRDDGIGGAQADGQGLVGLRDRVAAHGGRLAVDSPPGGGTIVDAAIPLPA